jgi:hypothetical protein
VNLRRQLLVSLRFKKIISSADCEHCMLEAFHCYVVTAVVMMVVVVVVCDGGSSSM